MKKVMLLAVCAVFLFACTRQPTANFSTDQDTYYSGETAHFNNTSVHYARSVWTTYDGQTTTSNNMDFTFPLNMSSGDYSFTLDVYNGRKHDQITRKIYVERASGEVTFWTNTNFYGNIFVSIDNANANITSYYNYQPNCGAQGCATFTLLPGTYDFYAQDSYLDTWNGTVTVTNQGCLMDLLN